MEVSHDMRDMKQLASKKRTSYLVSSIRSHAEFMREETAVP